MQFEWLALTGLFTGILVAAWSQVKAILWRAVSAVIVQASLEPGQSSWRFMHRIWSGDLKPGKLRDLYYAQFRQWSSKTRATQYFPGEYLGIGKKLLVWKGWIPILVERPQDSRIRITTLRWVLDLEKEFLQAPMEVPASSFRVARVTGQRSVNLSAGSGHVQTISSGSDPSPAASGFSSDANDLGNIDHECARPIGVNILEDHRGGSATILDDQALSPDKLDLVSECEHWAKMRSWYNERGVPWRRGYVFEGPPGTGKTSLAKAIAQKLRAPLYLFDLASFNDADFMSRWTTCGSSGNVAVVVFEDFDRIFDGDRNVTATDISPGLSYQCLLNSLDGASDVSGILLIVTVNDSRKLDGAIRRPGRIDAALQFGSLDYVSRKKICYRILQDWPEIAGQAAMETDGMTGAAVQEHCTKIALAKFWENPVAAIGSEGGAAEAGPA